MTEKQLTLRLPDDLHAAIFDLALEDVRSLNAEIVVLLREAIAARMRVKAMPGPLGKLFLLREPIVINATQYNAIHLTGTMPPGLSAAWLTNVEVDQRGNSTIIGPDGPEVPTGTDWISLVSRQLR